MFCENFYLSELNYRNYNKKTILKWWKCLPPVVDEVFEIHELPSWSIYITLQYVTTISSFKWFRHVNNHKTWIVVFFYLLNPHLGLGNLFFFKKQKKSMSSHVKLRSWSSTVTLDVTLIVHTQTLFMNWTGILHVHALLFCYPFTVHHQHIYIEV